MNFSGFHRNYVTLYPFCSLIILSIHVLTTSFSGQKYPLHTFPHRTFSVKKALINWFLRSNVYVYSYNLIPPLFRRGIDNFPLNINSVQNPCVCKKVSLFNFIIHICLKGINTFIIHSIWLNIKHFY